MKYLEFTFRTVPCTEIVNDVLSGVLGEAGFESFVEQTDGITAYIQKDLYSETVLKEALADFPLPDTQIAYSYVEAEDKDWNEEWEKNFFQPIVIGDRCVIHSTFHNDVPQAEYDIVINPQMAFGTGHHATTSLIIDRLLDMDLNGRRMVDMGTGTAFLAILAAMRGAEVTGVEIDPFAHANAIDNAALNGHPEIKLLPGDASVLADIKDVDLFVANINRNVIMADLPYYAATLADDAQVIFSGFYVEDVPVVVAAAEKCGLVAVNHTERDRWASLLLKKRPA